MPWPFRGQQTQGETDEERKKREDVEEQKFLEKIGLTVEAQLKPIRETVTTLQTDWQKLQSAANTELDEEKRKQAENDEQNLTAEQRAEKDKQALVAGIIQTNARMTESEILSEVRAKYPEFEAKIKEHLDSTPINRKALPDYPVYCRNVVTMVLGQAALAGGLRYDAAGKKFFLEDTQGRGEGEVYDFLGADMTWQDPRSGKIVTGREQLARLGISPEEFAKSLKQGVV